MASNDAATISASHCQDRLVGGVYVSRSEWCEQDLNFKSKVYTSLSGVALCCPFHCKSAAWESFMRDFVAISTRTSLSWFSRHASVARERSSIWLDLSSVASQDAVAGSTVSQERSDSGWLFLARREVDLRRSMMIDSTSSVQSVLIYS